MKTSCKHSCDGHSLVLMTEINVEPEAESLTHGCRAAEAIDVEHIACHMISDTCTLTQLFASEVGNAFIVGSFGYLSTAKETAPFRVKPPGST